MTDYFEIHERDGAARLAELRLDDPLVTPALADGVLADAGSLWVGQPEFAQPGGPVPLVDLEVVGHVSLVGMGRDEPIVSGQCGAATLPVSGRRPPRVRSHTEYCRDVTGHGDSWSALSGNTLH